MDDECLVIGAGITGITLARVLAESGEKVVVYESRENIGGNCTDHFEDHQYIQDFGPHIFHTKNEEVWTFLSRFTDWHKYKHKVYANIKDKMIHLPFNFQSIDESFSKEKAEIIKKKLSSMGKDKYSILELREIKDPIIKELAEYVYENVFLNYTIKQWGHKPDELDPNVVGRVPVVASYQEGYFMGDTYQGIPVKGFSEMLKKIIDHENIELRFGKILKKDISEKYKKVIVTGPVDEFYDNIFGEIKYRRIYLEFTKIDKESFQENSVINYPNTEKFTRITEYNKFLDIKGPTTVISKEYAYWDKGFSAYPLLTKENGEIIEKYIELAKTDGFVLAGRLAECKYYNMDNACARGLAAVRDMK